MRRSPKAATFFLGQCCRDPTRNGVGNWFEIFTPVFFIAATKSVTRRLPAKDGDQLPDVSPLIKLAAAGRIPTPARIG
jgi:hypothetical protein